MSVNLVLKTKIYVHNVSLDTDYGNLNLTPPLKTPIKTSLNTPIYLNVNNVNPNVYNVMKIENSVLSVKKDITYSMEYVDP